MVVIIRKENGKPIYNTMDADEKERSNALKLDKLLEEAVTQMERKWSKRIVNNKGHKRIDICVIFNIGRILSKIVDDISIVNANERKWVWKAIREIYLKDKSILKTGATRDYLEYFYLTAKLDKEFINKISWPALRQLFHYTKLREDNRFWEWIIGKSKSTRDITITFMGVFGRKLYSLIRNKDTSVFSDKELFDIYENAWDETTKSEKQ